MLSSPAWILEPELRKIRLDDKDYIQRLTKAMSRAKQTIEDLYYEPNLYEDILEILGNLDAGDQSFHVWSQRYLLFPG